MLHLIHPALVHFSVALLVVGGLTEAYGLITNRASATRLGSPLVLIGTLSLVPTIATGYVAANSVDLPGAAGAVLDAHERNAMILIGVFTLSQFWKGWHRGRIPEAQQPLYAALLVLGVGFAAYGALLGGELVYAHGVGVGVGS